MTGMSLCNCAGWQPPRHASAEPEACHVACFLTAVGLPRFDPGPEGEGGRVQNAGEVRLPLVAVCAWRCLVWIAAVLLISRFPKGRRNTCK